MQNIDVRFNATSNFSKVKADLASLEAQAAALNATFQKGAYAKGAHLVDPAAWSQATSAVTHASRVFKDAASSSGQLTTQQIRATSEAERYTKALQKQKLSMQDMMKHRGIMKQVYQDQLRYQRMTAQYWGTDSLGRAVTDIAIPKNVPKDLDTMRRRMGFFGNAAASAATQVVNLGKNIQWSGRQLTVGFTYPMAMFGAAAGVMAYKTEDAFSRIAKVYDYSAKAQMDAGQREKEVNNLRMQSMDNARKVAEEYGISVVKTLEVQQQLAATGLRGKDLFSSAGEVQRISMLGDIDPQQTTEMVVALKTAFRKTIPDAQTLTNTLNYMNAASNASSLSLQDIAEATPRAATAIAQLGGTVQDMTAILTAMREAGVNAAEGANAIKSASTRVLNPVPKALDYYSKFGINLESMRNASGGNLLDFLKLLGKAQQRIEGPTKKATDMMRAQGVAMLFGTYQNNRLTAALTNLTDAYGGVNNQTRKVLDLGEQSNKQLATMAKVSQDIVMQNAAGRLRKEWAKFQMELSEMGAPFLKAATEILSIFTKFGKMFNSMSDGKKEFAMWVAAILALVGPVVMVTGLFMNLFGQFVKGTGTLFKFLGVSRLVNREEQAAALATQAQNSALQKQQLAVSTLAQEVRILAESYHLATRSAQAMLGAQGAAAAGTAARPMGPATGPASHPFVAAPPRTTPLTYSYSRGKNAAETSANREASRAAAIQAAARAEQTLVTQRAQSTRQAEAQRKITERTNKLVGGMGMSMSLMTASMATMMVSSNETANNIAKWVLLSSMIAPLLKGALVAGNGLVTRMLAMTAASGGMAGALAKAGGAMAVLKAGAAGVATAIGPVGWLALGIGAVGTAMWYAKKRSDEIAEKQRKLISEQRAASKALQSSTSSIATSLGKAAGSYKEMVNATPGSSGSKASDAALQRYNYYSEDKDGQKEVKGLLSSKGEFLEQDALMARLREKFINLQVIGSDTAQQARDDVKAMLVAAGYGLADATTKADELFYTLGNISKLDWSGTIKDQAQNLSNILGGASFSAVNLTNAAGMTASDWKPIDETTLKDLEIQAARASKIVNHAMATATSPAQAKKYFGQYMDTAMQEWNSGFDTIVHDASGAGKAAQEVFDKFGVDSASKFAKAWNENADFRKALEGPMNSLGGKFIADAVKAGSTWEGIIVQSTAGMSGLSKEVDTVADAWRELLNLPAMVSEKGAASFVRQSAAYKEMIALQRAAYAAGRGGELGSKEGLEVQERLDLATKKTTASVNRLNKQFGNKQGKDFNEAMYNLINSVKVGEKGVDRLGNKIKNLKGKTVTIRVNQVGGIVQNAMSNVQNEMADSAMNSLNSRWDNTMASAQATWDNRSNALEASHEAASRRMEEGQEAAQRAFESRWERRKEAIERAYDKRIQAVKNQIKVEQDADKERQRIFEAEKARLQRLAEMQNADIDFNVALDTGKLDEAAKIQNNAGAKAATDQMDAEAAAASARMEAKIAALEKKNERLEKAKDRELKQLEKMEERQRRALERMQEARSRALEKSQRQETNALEKSEDAAMASLEKRREYDRAMLEQRLELFKSYTARNQKDLERWMKKVGLTYDDFGIAVKAKGERWSSYFEKSLSSHIRQAGMEVMNDNIWENVGKRMADKILKGLGFNDMTEFRNFVKTGNRNGEGGKGGDPETRHDGGVVGSGGGSRGSIPNTYKGLHRSEKMIRAQKGEYVVRKDVAQKNLGLLHALNSGISDPGVMGGLGTKRDNSLSGLGMAGMVPALISRMFMRGAETALGNKYASAAAKWAKSSKYAGNAGTYSGMNFTAAQMKNAATIANVGSSMGMTKRDIQIGIMTAIAESGLKNVNYGDRDSLGLFQQRPSMGWGSASQVTDPKYASSKFFGALRTVSNRGEMSPWDAAQAVQRSAFSDGSNYRQYWDEATAIFTKGLKKGQNGNYGSVTGGGYVPGAGGKHRPINGPATSGLHGGNSAGNPPALDFAGPSGRPVYAIADGVITQSRDIRGPLSTDTYRGTGPYGSFGRMIQMRTDGGAYALYAHLSRRSVGENQRVRGGSVIGYSGNSGNSSGAHLHFGATNGPYAWLRKGGEVKWDNTKAVLHKGETVLTKPLTQQFKNNVSGGAGGDTFQVTLDLRGATIKEDVDIERAVNKVLDYREAKVGRRRVVD